MSDRSNVRKLFVAATATAICAVGMVTVAETAQAVPKFKECQFPGRVSIDHTNGWRVFADGSQFSMVGFAEGEHPSGGRSRGHIAFFMEGINVQGTIEWDHGAMGRYEGQVNDDGIARGWTQDMKHPENKAFWTIREPMYNCVRW